MVVAAGEVVVGALVPILVPVVGLMQVAAVPCFCCWRWGSSAVGGWGSAAAAAAGGGGGSSARQGQCCSSCWRQTVGGGSNVSSGGGKGGGCVKGSRVGGCTSSSD